MFDVGNHSEGEGGTDEKPIVLEGYKSEDFECLLKILLHQPLDPFPPALEKQEWSSVLKLATIWQMDKVRTLAIDRLSALELSPIEKIQHARQYHVSAWFKEGVVAIATNWDDYEMEEVEASLYSVPKQTLTTQSPVFEGMFDVGDQSGGEGISDDKPIVLEGYRSDDFECLLKVLIPEPFEPSPALSKQEWTSVLKLATIWQMDKARKAAIDQLSALDLSPIEKIQHAREYRVTTWFKEGIAAIANQFGKYETEDLGGTLGWKTTALILSLRDKAKPKGPQWDEIVKDWECPCGSALTTGIQGGYNKQYLECPKGCRSGYIRTKKTLDAISDGSSVSGTMGDNVSEDAISAAFAEEIEALNAYVVS
ncbi:hypothetical protein BKA70DRAFT_1149782 [Coprinopsis sp. MPI-PUGE-AT-0042]|nr:hypothetical protein BKA70DRAFT_1149782 [Coprinopsis sp. MPI-PUGE-AT-0042]